MTRADAVRSRIERLRAEAFEALGVDESGQVKPGTLLNDAGGLAWLVALDHVIDLTCPQDSSAYRQWIKERKRKLASDSRPNVYGAVVEGREVLRRLLADLDDGLIGSIADRAAAETFDTFLDHGADYLKLGRKDEAGVIAGVVFEDTIRRICRNNDIEENDVKLDQLVSELTKRDLITGLKAKRARAAAGLRTSAAHARWEEFEASDVGPVIDLTRELLEAHLDKSV
jgi:hypothetical protein